MFVRTTKVKSGGKTREYAQLVESVRRESDGMPVHRVVASLGRYDPVMVENLRTALRAAKGGRTVVVSPLPRRRQAAIKPTASLRYLDVAVLLQLWRDCGLEGVVGELMPAGGHDVSPADVVAALVVQACLQPGTELSATRWFPRTALPELLDIPLKRFNNTRLHRVLGALEQVETALQRKLPRMMAAQRNTTFAALFLDVSDAWYVGQGAPLAQKAKTKEGLVKRKIGIVLLCNEQGYPLRWDVVGGARYDGDVMSKQIAAVAGLSWVDDVPLVCDRAMGKTAYVRTMLGTDVRFVTAMTVKEFDRYAPQLPCTRLSQLDTGGPETRDADIAAAAACAQTVGLQCIADNLWVIDLGVAQLDPPSDPPVGANTADADSAQDVTVNAMRVCRAASEGVDNGRYPSFAAASRALGISKGLVSKYRILARLPHEVQRDILAGKAAGYPISQLIAIAQLQDATVQRTAWAQLMQSPRARGRCAARSPNRSRGTEPVAQHDGPPLCIRVVAYFNPQLFVDRRLTAQRRRDDIQRFVAQLNQQLASPRSKRSRDGIAAAVDRKLRRYDLLQAFDLDITLTTVAGRSCYQVRLQPNATQWARRQRYDGFTVLVAHPSLAHSAAQLCQLYRAKDTVEKDFQIIKSLLEVRPLRHRTDDKLRAHVTLRMLALLLERTLHQKLQSRCTAAAALEHLADCRLNHYRTGGQQAVYSVTQPDSDQQTILRALRLQHLADDEEVTSLISPR